MSDEKNLNVVPDGHHAGTYKDGIPHHVGAAPSLPTDISLWKKQSIDVMKQYTEEQLKRLSEHADLVVKQVKEILSNNDLAQRVTLSDFRFEPVVGKTYFLYEHKDGGDILALSTPNEWKRCYGKIYNLVSAVKFRADRTWEAVEYPVHEMH